MGNTDLIIHKPDAPLTMPDQELIEAVVAATDGPQVSDEYLEQLHNQILQDNRDLIEDGLLYPDRTGLRGERCLVVDVSDHVVPLLVKRLSHIAAGMGLVVVSELDDLVFAYGNEIPGMSIRTYEWDIAWASPRALPQWLERTTMAMNFYHDRGDDAVDFLIIEDTSKEHQFIQTIYRPAIEAYQVEVRDGGADAHYQAMIASYDETLAAFETWMATGERLPQVDWALIDM